MKYALYIILWCVTLTGHATPQPFVVTEMEGEFREVKVTLLDIIRGKGLNISATLHAGRMLERTAKDFGESGSMYGDAETIEFCSARIAHVIAKANPHNVLLCPFRIAVYTLTSKPGTVYLSYLPPRGEDEEATNALAPMRDLYAEIVQEVSDW
jgi:uncharacterized protein (DUF302 family)